MCRLDIVTSNFGFFKCMQGRSLSSLIGYRNDDFSPSTHTYVACFVGDWCTLQRTHLKLSGQVRVKLGNGFETLR